MRVDVLVVGRGKAGHSILQEPRDLSSVTEIAPAPYRWV
ncbi:hypothetical protein DB32_002409 [Sandaracinus amylolyticus]|uniref:Uncharacterized protein n=1 Tax=Sandaracinus amylolyticus TaxID=927083 RepID=A0A0F6YHX9_9BACT|nr:hypothetical protein DB32_002409 [Sandaracinus amylolyticus]